MLNQSEINELFQLWSKLSFTKLLVVNQLNGKFQIEFVLDFTGSESAKAFLKDIQSITIKKHPPGTVAWVGYWSVHSGQNTQFNRFRIDFWDTSIKKVENTEEFTEKLTVYGKDLIRLLKEKYLHIKG